MTCYRKTTWCMFKIWQVKRRRLGLEMIWILPQKGSLSASCSGEPSVEITNGPFKCASARQQLGRLAQQAFFQDGKLGRGQSPTVATKLRINCGSRFSGFDLKGFFNSLTAFVIFEFWKSFDIGQFGNWEPFAFSCLCISSILILMKGRPGRRRSRPFSRRHEELFKQDLPTDGPPLGLPPPITLFNTRAVHPSRCTSQTINATAPLDSQFTVAPNATSPAHSTNSSSSIQTRIHNQKSLLKQPIASPDLQLFALKLHHHQVSQLQPKLQQNFLLDRNFSGPHQPQLQKQKNLVDTNVVLVPIVRLFVESRAVNMCDAGDGKVTTIETWSEMGVQLSAKKGCSPLCLGTELTRLKNRLASIHC